MHSTLNLKETDDPHDGPAIAPDVVPAAWADRVLADIKRDAVSGATGKKLDTGPSVAAGAAAPSVDTTFRATAVNKVQVSGDRPSSGSWTSRAVMAFMFALCSALAAAAWQHYGHTAKQMIADWTPPFVLAASPASEKTGLTEQPGSPAVQAAAADQPAQAAGSTQPTDGATPAAALAPESAQLLQSMARDLAAMGQQVEQLKASIAELKAGRQAMSPEAARTSVATPSVAGTPEIRAPEPNLRPKMSALPPRPAAAPPVRKPRPAYYPPAQSAAPPPVPLAAPPPPQPAPQPQTAGRLEDEPVARPPMPMRW
jgi:hypothetical protein